MSEKEKLRRSAYQEHRKQMIIRQAIVIVLLTAVLIGCCARLVGQGDSYVVCQENGNAVYKAYLQDNEFYEEEYLNGSHAYVASLIDYMSADFSYDLALQAKSVRYTYDYTIQAQVEVKDKNSQMAIFNPVYPLKESTGNIAEGNKLTVCDAVILDYNNYNKIAKDFIAAYSLHDVEASLIVTMDVHAKLQGKTLAKGSDTNYTVSLHVPLNKATVAPFVQTPTDTGTQKILAASNINPAFSKTLAIIFGIADLIAVIILAMYILFTRDKHIDYSRKVKRILSSYKSYIQRINNSFDTTNYQVLHVDTFTELLEIRDTLQIPILMYENEDQTFSNFFIPANCGLLYSYTVCVEGLQSKPQAADKESAPSV